MSVDESRQGAWQAMQDRNGRRDRATVQDAPLFGGGGGGTSGGMDSVDAKIAAAEARTDTKFAELRGDLAKFATKGTVWGAMATALGIILAVAALSTNRFDAGMTVRSTTQSIVDDQKRRDQDQDHKLDEILKRLPEPASKKTDR